MINPSENPNIIVRLFVGYPLTSQLKFSLENSLSWKQASILPKEEKSLTIVSHEGHEYIGVYFLNFTQGITLPDIRQIAASVQQTILSHYPECTLHTSAAVAFPVVFI